MRPRRAIAISALSVTAFALGACELFYSFDGYGTGGVDGGDGAITSDAPASQEASCALARWPDRPTVDDPGDAGDLTLVATSVDLGLGDGGLVEGFDLDGLCTCPDAPSCVSADDHCDGDGGSDRGGNELFVRLSAYGKFVDQAQLNGYVAGGRFSFLLGLKGYNGAANDTDVRVSFYSSAGTPIGDGGKNVTPKFDGTDTWTYADDSVVDDAGPPFAGRYVDPHAYVADHVLVARLDFPLVVPTQTRTVTIDLHGGVIVAPLVRDGDRWRIAGGRLTGRWPRNNLLAAVAAAKDPLGPGFLCGDSGTYQSLKPQLCGGADIATSASADRSGAACDALAIVVGFTSVDTQGGALGKLPGADASAGCGADYHDECP